MITPYDLYLDHAATSLPRSQQAVKVATQAMALGNAQRGFHPQATTASQTITRARQSLGKLVGVSDRTHQVCFLPSATAALNQAILGLRPRPRRIAIDPLAHNATYRPLQALTQQQGIPHWILPHDSHGSLDIPDIQRQWQADTDLVILTHASNVTGLVQPVAAVMQAIQNNPEADTPKQGTQKQSTNLSTPRFLIDAAQTAGVIDIKDLAPADMIAFGAHKGLRSLPGVGTLIVANDITLEPLIYGGTGSESAAVNMPKSLPTRLEAGTLNLPAIAAMAASAEAYLNQPSTTSTPTPHAITPHQSSVSSQSLRHAITTGGGRILPIGPHPAVPVASFTLPNLPVWEAADRLERCFSLQLRAGLHCAPLAHQTLNTFPEGTLRLSAGATTTPQDMLYLTQALRSICQPS